jgi:hypothetical protein
MPTLPTINDVQAVNPVLTNLLIGYMQNDDRFVAGRVFPSVSVDKDSGTYYIVTKKFFFFDDLEPRAPGAPLRTLDYGVSTSTYTTLQYAGEVRIADETRANSQLAMDLEQVGVRRLAQASMIRKEVDFSTNFMATGVWGTDDTTTTDWDDFTAGDPVNDVLTAVRTISDNTGQDANSMVLGSIVDQALRNHPDIIDRLKHTQAATQATIRQALASIFGVENYFVGRASYSNTNEAVAFSSTAIIDDDCLVCHVDPGAGVMGATAGKTFVWQPGGGIGTVYSQRDGLKFTDVMQHKEQWDQVATATDLGYFFSNVV